MQARARTGPLPPMVSIDDMMVLGIPTLLYLLLIFFTLIPTLACMMRPYRPTYRFLVRGAFFITFA